MKKSELLRRIEAAQNRIGAASAERDQVNARRRALESEKGRSGGGDRTAIGALVDRRDQLTAEIAGLRRDVKGMEAWLKSGFVETSATS